MAGVCFIARIQLSIDTQTRLAINQSLFLIFVWRFVMGRVGFDVTGNQTDYTSG
jgi:hypothetical protein